MKTMMTVAAGLAIGYFVWQYIAAARPVDELQEQLTLWCIIAFYKENVKRNFVKNPQKYKSIFAFFGDTVLIFLCYLPPQPHKLNAEFIPSLIEIKQNFRQEVCLSVTNTYCVALFFRIGD